MIARPLVLVCAALAGALAFSVPAGLVQAQPQEQAGPDQATQARARELFLRGDRLYAEGRYDESVGAFLESYQLSGRPELLFNLANAYERLNRLEEALDALREYAPHTPSYDEETIQRRIRNIQERIHEQEENRQAEEARIAEEVAASGVLADDGPDLTGPIAVMAAGGAAAATGVVFAILAGSAGSDAEEACFSNGLCTAAAQESIDDEKTFSLVADISGSLGAALLAGGIVWMFVALDDDGETADGTEEDAEEPVVRLLPTLGPTQAGLQTQVLF